MMSAVFLGAKRWQPLLIPILAAIPLHRNARRIAHLNPCGVRTGAVGRIYWQSRSKNKRGTMFLSAVLHSACIIWCRPIAPPRAPIAKAEPEMAIIYGVSTLRTVPPGFPGGHRSLAANARSLTSPAHGMEAPDQCFFTD
jgi:hypothetical protein